MATGHMETDGQGLHLVFIEKEIKLWRKVVLLAPDLRINPRSAFLGPTFQVSSLAWPLWGLGPCRSGPGSRPLRLPSSPARTGRRVMKSQLVRSGRIQAPLNPGCRLVVRKPVRGMGVPPCSLTSSAGGSVQHPSRNTDTQRPGWHGGRTVALPFPAGGLAGPLTPKANFSEALPGRRREAAPAGSLERRERPSCLPPASGAGPGPGPGTWGGGRGNQPTDKLLHQGCDMSRGRFPSARSPRSLLI